MALVSRTLTGVSAPSWDLAAPWATVADLVAPCCPGEGDDQELMSDALMGATMILYNLTGQQWAGASSDVIRPTADEAPGLDAWYPYDGYSGVSGRAGMYAWPGMFGMCGCNRVSTCGGFSVSEITLPGWPAITVTEVKIDGAVLSSAHYKLQDRRRLVYRPQAGETRQGWPCCQDVTLDVDRPGTWQVSYTWGVSPPPFWKDMAAMLGCQLYVAMVPARNGECRLPKRIQSITRQGVTIAVIDNYDVFAKGLTGLPEIDLAIGALRYGNADGARVVVPGKQPSYRRDG